MRYYKNALAKGSHITIKLPKDGKTTKKNMPARLYWVRKCGLHLLIHTSPPESSAQNVEKKKAEPRTPHFLNLNQDIVAWPQNAKVGIKVCNPHFQSLNGALKRRSRSQQGL